MWKPTLECQSYLCANEYSTVHYVPVGTCSIFGKALMHLQKDPCERMPCMSKNDTDIRKMLRSDINLTWRHAIRICFSVTGEEKKKANEPLSPTSRQAPNC